MIRALFWKKPLPFVPQAPPWHTHPPHPLIGLEYEPQLTFLEHPKLPVYVREGEEITIRRESFLGGERVILTLPATWDCFDPSHENLEIRTAPVPLEHLGAEILRVTARMERLICTIAREVGPVGVFLPGFPCTKHVNLSFPYDPPPEFFPINKWKIGRFGPRYHINVPYPQTNYEALLARGWSAVQRLDEGVTPVFLGYSTTGRKYVRKSPLI